jgi:hypothetical protein
MQIFEIVEYSIVVMLMAFAAFLTFWLVRNYPNYQRPAGGEAGD